MPTSKRSIALIAGALVTAAGCNGGGGGAGEDQGGASQPNDGGGPGGTRIGTSGARIAAGGVVPGTNALSAKRPDKPDSAAGGNLFAAMNCDGCHGGGASGWVGPSLGDGRWRYGGEDSDIFNSIFYGRPKGMPAYGGAVGRDGVWMLVNYLKSLPKPNAVPTQSWIEPQKTLPQPNRNEETSTAAAATTDAPREGGGP